jgi:hypothetical protein
VEVCKTVGIAYVGSNPTPATEVKQAVVSTSPGAVLSSAAVHSWDRRPALQPQPFEGLVLRIGLAARDTPSE